MLPRFPRIPGGCVFAKALAVATDRFDPKNSASMSWRFLMPAYRCKLSWSRRSFGRTFAACFLALIGFACRAQASIAFVQQNSADPQTPQTTGRVTYTFAQTGGNLNVVVVGWNDSTTAVSSVRDTSGNVYALAVGPTVQAGTASQAIYYAKNISGAAAGANTVTVTFTAAAI